MLKNKGRNMIILVVLCLIVKLLKRSNKLRTKDRTKNEKISLKKIEIFIPH